MCRRCWRHAADGENLTSWSACTRAFTKHFRVHKAFPNWQMLERNGSLAYQDNASSASRINFTIKRRAVASTLALYGSWLRGRRVCIGRAKREIPAGFCQRTTGSRLSRSAFRQFTDVWLFRSIAGGSSATQLIGEVAGSRKWYHKLEQATGVLLT